MVERCAEWDARRQARRSFRLEEKAADELTGCTFAPLLVSRTSAADGAAAAPSSSPARNEVDGVAAFVARMALARERDQAQRDALDRLGLPQQPQRSPRLSPSSSRARGKVVPSSANTRLPLRRDGNGTAIDTGALSQAMQSPSIAARRSAALAVVAGTASPHPQPQWQQQQQHGSGKADDDVDGDVASRETQRREDSSAFSVRSSGVGGSGEYAGVHVPAGPYSSSSSSSSSSGPRAHMNGVAAVSAAPYQPDSQVHGTAAIAASTSAAAGGFHALNRRAPTPPLLLPQSGVTLPMRTADGYDNRHQQQQQQQQQQYQPGDNVALTAWGGVAQSADTSGPLALPSLSLSYSSSPSSAALTTAATRIVVHGSTDTVYVKSSPTAGGSQPGATGAVPAAANGLVSRVLSARKPSVIMVTQEPPPHYVLSSSASSTQKQQQQQHSFSSESVQPSLAVTAPLPSSVTAAVPRAAPLSRPSSSSNYSRGGGIFEAARQPSVVPYGGPLTAASIAASIPLRELYSVRR